MKKFLIAIILIIPIVIILTLSLTGTVIKATTKVPVERLEIRDYLNNEVNYSKTVEMELVGAGLEINVATFPGIAYDHSVEIKMAKGSIGEVEIKKLEGKNRYMLTPKVQGKLTLVVLASSNIEARKSLNFYIKATAVGELQISVDNVRYVEGETVKVNTSKQFSFNPYPIEAIGDNYMEWSVEDQSVATIDKNGFMNILKRGTTNVSASIKDRAGNFNKITVVVDTNKAVVKKNEIHSFRPLTIDEIKNMVVLDVNATTVALSQNSFKVKNGEVEEIVTVTIVDANEFMFTESLPNLLYTLNGGYHTELIYKDTNNTNKLDVTISSTDSSILDIVDNKIILKKPGTVTIKAKNNVTKVEIFKNVEVLERILYFNLNLSQADNEKGIGKSRVYAFNWFDGALDKVKHTFDLGYNKESVLPRNSKVSLVWSVDNNNYATVDNNGFVEFKEQVIGNSVTVTAHEYINGVKTDINASYIFSFTDDPNARNVETAEEFKYTTENLFATIAMQKDIKINPGEVWDEKVNIRNDIFGNGFKYERYSSPDKMGQEMFVMGKDVSSYEGMKIENLIVYRNNPEETRYRGEILFFAGRQYTDNIEEINKRPIVIKNCLLSYAEVAVRLPSYAAVNVTMEGSIISNMTVGGIVLECAKPENSSLTFKNSVMRECLGPGVLMSPPIDSGKFVVSNQCLPNIAIEGFLDTYAWIKIKEVGGLLSFIDFSSLGNVDLGFGSIDLGAALKKEMENLVTQLFSQNGLEEAVYRYKDEDYVNMTMVLFCLWADSDPARIKDKTGDFTSIKTGFSTKTKFILLGIPLSMSAIEGIVGKFVNDDKPINLRQNNYFVSYKHENPRIKPDSVCPSNEALYEELLNGRQKTPAKVA